MLFTLILAGIIILTVLWKWLGRPVQFCPGCGEKREDDAQICGCGWIFEPPETTEELEYAEEDEFEGKG